MVGLAILHVHANCSDDGEMEIRRKLSTCDDETVVTVSNPLQVHAASCHVRNSSWLLSSYLCKFIARLKSFAKLLEKSALKEF